MIKIKNKTRFMYIFDQKQIINVCLGNKNLLFYLSSSNPLILNKECFILDKNTKYIFDISIFKEKYQTLDKNLNFIMRKHEIFKLLQNL